MSCDSVVSGLCEKRFFYNSSWKLKTPRLRQLPQQTTCTGPILRAPQPFTPKPQVRDVSRRRTGYDRIVPVWDVSEITREATCELNGMPVHANQPFLLAGTGWLNNPESNVADFGIYVREIIRPGLAFVFCCHEKRSETEVQESETRIGHGVSTSGKSWQ